MTIHPRRTCSVIDKLSLEYDAFHVVLSIYLRNQSLRFSPSTHASTTPRGGIYAF
jgi:hypothetical protein